MQGHPVESTSKSAVFCHGTSTDANPSFHLHGSRSPIRQEGSGALPRICDLFLLLSVGAGTVLRLLCCLFCSASVRLRPTGGRNKQDVGLKGNLGFEQSLRWGLDLGVWESLLEMGLGCIYSEFMMRGLAATRPQALEPLTQRLEGSMQVEKKQGWLTRTPGEFRCQLQIRLRGHQAVPRTESQHVPRIPAPNTPPTEPISHQWAVNLKSPKGSVIDILPFPVAGRASHRDAASGPILPTCSSE